jgi:hypothetical protein
LLPGDEHLGTGDYPTDYELWSFVKGLGEMFELSARPKWSNIVSLFDPGAPF